VHRPGSESVRHCFEVVRPFEFTWFTAVTGDSEVSIAALFRALDVENVVLFHVRALALALALTLALALLVLLIVELSFDFDFSQE